MSLCGADLPDEPSDLPETNEAVERRRNQQRLVLGPCAAGQRGSESLPEVREGLQRAGGLASATHAKSGCDSVIRSGWVSKVGVHLA